MPQQSHMKRIVKIYAASFEGLSKDIYIFASMMLINRIGTLILPFLTLYTTQHLGWSKIDAGTATMCFGIGSLCGALLGGYLTDRIGYYRTMVISLFAASCLFFSLQFFSDFHILCGLLLVSSMMADLLRPALMTGVTFFTTKVTQTRAVSLLRMSFNLGIAIGPYIAGHLIVHFGYSLIFVVDSLTCLAAGIFLVTLVKEKKRDQTVEPDTIVKDKKSPYRDGYFLLFMLVSLLMLVSFFQILFTVPLYMVEVLGYTEKHVGYFYGVNGLLIVIFEMPLVHWLETRYDNFKVMAIGSGMIGAAILIFVFPLPSLFLMTFYSIFVGFGEIVNFPFIASTSMDRATSDTIGQYMSVNTVMFSLSLIIAPILGTAVLDAYGYSMLFGVMFGLCIISIIGLGILRPRMST